MFFYGCQKIGSPGKKSEIHLLVTFPLKWAFWDTPFSHTPYAYERWSTLTAITICGSPPLAKMVPAPTDTTWQAELEYLINSEIGIHQASNNRKKEIGNGGSLFKCWLTLDFQWFQHHERYQKVYSPLSYRTLEGHICWMELLLNVQCSKVIKSLTLLLVQYIDLI